MLHRYMHGFFHKILQIPCFLKCVCMVLQCFLSKHGNLHICRHKTVPKTSFFTMFPIPLSPQTLENSATYTVFFNFSMFQCRWPTQTYIPKILQKHCFYIVVTLFSVKNTVIYTLFGIKSVQHIGFCSVFGCSGIQKPFKISLFTKMTQNSISISS